MNPNTGDISVCHAKSVDSCLYGNIAGNSNHYQNEYDARIDMEKRFSNKFGFLGFSKRSEKKFDRARNIFVHNFNKKVLDGNGLDLYRYALSFVNESSVNFQIVSSVIDERINYSGEKNEDMLDKTAILLESYMNSRFFNDLVLNFIGPSLGHAKNTKNGDFDQEVLNHSFSASDVGKLASYDFWDRNDPDRPDYVDDNVKKMLLARERVFGLGQDQKFFDKEKSGDNSWKRGARYRGNVWERKIRNDLAADYPHLMVASAEGQLFRNRYATWQMGYVDGILSDDEYERPNGILEIKTSSSAKSWEKGIPLNYRAQTLYYMHITGFKYAKLRAVINENDTRDFDLSIDDEVAPGTGITMEEYIQNRVIPWLGNAKKQAVEKHPENNKYKIN